MPFLGFPNFQSCQSEIISQGHTEEEARRICGFLQSKAEGKNTEQLSESELKVVNEYMQKFQDDGRPSKEWFDSCLSKNGDKADPSAFCGFLWSTVVKGQGADPQEVLKNSGGYSEAFNKAIQFIKQFSETVTLNDEEIFAVGTWNGDKYTHEDLKEIADNFNKLKDEVKPPVKLGHSEKQKLLEADDLPAGGWVKSLKVAGDKLLAEIGDIPKKIYELIKNRAYKRKSAEIYPEYTGADGKRYGKVLRAIAFLGGATPAIATLNDIKNLYSGKKDNQKFKAYDLMKGGERVMKTLGIQVQSEAFGEDFQKKFNEALKTAFGEDVSVKFEGDTTDSDTIKGLKDKIAELEKEIEDYRKEDDDEDMDMMKSKVDTLTKELSDAKVKLTDSEKKATELSESKTKLAEAEKKLSEQEIANHNESVKSFIEKAKADGKILPAHEQLLSVLMKQIDRKTVVKFTEKDKDGKDVQAEKTPIELVKAFVESLPKVVEFKEISVNTNVIETFTADGGKVKIGEQVFEVDDVNLAASARKYAEEHKVEYSVALAEVAKASK